MSCEKHHQLKLTCMKTGSYALMHFVIAIVVAYVLTRSWQAALAIGMIEPIVQTVAFHFHDRAWKQVETDQQKSVFSSVELG